ncbi:MAG TPA: hypothetical protein V6D47_16820 [Oscillatoriaceae cyanobacterium]
MAFLAQLAMLAATTLHTAFYSSVLKAVVIPYTGRPPVYAIGTAVNPPRVFLNVRASYGVGTRWGRAPGNLLLADWSMAPQSRVTTRVTLTMRHPGRVRVFDNVRRHWLVVVPQAAAWHAPRKRPTAKPKPHVKAKSKPASHGAPAVRLGAARWDPWQRAIAIPYAGHFPSFHLGTANDPPRAFVDFKATGLRYPQKVAVKGQPSLVRYEAASRGPDVTRVVLTFRQATPVRVQDDRVRHEVLIVPEHSTRQASHGHRAIAHHATPARTPMPTEPPSGDQDPTLSAP